MYPIKALRRAYNQTKGVQIMVNKKYPYLNRWGTGGVTVLHTALPGEPINADLNTIERLYMPGSKQRAVVTNVYKVLK